VLAVVNKHLDMGLQHKPHIVAANIFAVVLVHTRRVFHKALQLEEKLQLQQATLTAPPTLLWLLAAAAAGAGDVLGRHKFPVTVIAW